MLDTTICIDIIRRRPPSVLERFGAFAVGDIGLSAVTVAELEYGAGHSKDPRRNREALGQFTAPLEIAAFDREAAEAYGRIRPKRTAGSGLLWNGRASPSVPWTC